MALLQRLELNRCFVIHDSLSKSFCWRTMSFRRYFWCGFSKTFYLSAAGKLPRLRCNSEVVFICADHSQELFLPLALLSLEGWLILSSSPAKKFNQRWRLGLVRKPYRLFGVNWTFSSHLKYWCPLGLSAGRRCSWSLLLWDPTDLGQEHQFLVDLYLHSHWVDSQETQRA